MKEQDEDELLLRCDEEVDYDDDDGENVLMQDGQVESEPAPAVESEVIDRQEEDEKVNNKSSSCSSKIVQVEPELGIKDDIIQKEQPLYALRRNPKRSQRLIDEEYTLDISASVAASPAATKKSTSILSEKAKACTECGKEFSSWKALFGHMRCHPEREWRGIQRPDNLSQYQQQHDKLTKRNSSKKPKPLVLDHEELLESSTPTFMKVASDNESDTESIEAAYMNDCKGSFSKGKITGKRSKRPRQMTDSVVSSSSCLQHELLAVTATTPTEVKEEREMANCLVMLACAGRGLSSSDEFVQSEEEEEEDSSTNDMNGNGGGASWSSDEVEDEEADVTGLKNSRDLDEDQQQQKQHDGGGTGNGGSTVVTMMGSSSTGNGGFSTVVVDDSSLCGGGNGGGELLDHEFETSGGSASGVRMKYECSTCKRIFKSHQALGGHRASHKKVKGCFARTNLGSDGIVEGSAEEVMDEDFLCSEEQLSMDFQQHHQLHYHNNHHHHHPLPITSAMLTHLRHPSLETGKDELGDTTFNSNRKFIKGHECSICHRVFTSGQALGGHKRCHWGGTERVLDSSTNFVTVSKPGGSSLYFGQVGGSSSFSMSRAESVVKEELLDLNLPAPVEDEDEEDGEEDDVKINNKYNRNNNNNSPNKMVYKLPQLVPGSALKRNAGAMSNFNAYLDIDKSYLDKEGKKKLVVEEQQQQHLDKMVSGGNKVEFRCFSCEV